MTPPAVGRGTLSRLGEAFAGRRALSVYLDIGSGARGRQRQFEVLTEELPLPLDQAIVARVHSMLGCGSTLAHGTKALALFLAADGSAEAMVPLPVAVEPMAVLERIAWLEPLVGMLTSGNWGAAIVSGRMTRLLRGGQAGLIEFALLDEGIDYPRGAGAACSPSLAGRAVRQHRWEHAGNQIVAMLARAHRREPFERMAIAAPRELWPLIEHQLDDALHRQLVGLLAVGRAVDLRLQEAVLALLAHQDSGSRRCCRSTATPLPELGATTVSPTSARLLPRLPQGQLA